MLQILIIITVIIFTIQVLLAITGWWEQRNLPKKYTISLGSQITSAQLLEKYSKIVRPINLRVNPAIQGIAEVKRDLLMVSRRHVYRNDLYGTAVVLWNIKLTKPDNFLLQEYQKWQGLFFLCEVVFLIAAIFAWELFAVGAFLFALGLWAFSYYMQWHYNQIISEYTDYAIDLLELDGVEAEWVSELGNKYRSQTFLYPIKPVKWIVQFINPF